MSFGKLKRRLQALINRKDFSSELAGEFIADAITDMERQLRIGPMEVLLSSSDWDGKADAIDVPSNYLESSAIFTDHAELKEASLPEFLALPTDGGCPTHYHKASSRIMIRPTPPSGSTVYVRYYGAAPELVDDADTNVWVANCFNAVLYTAAGLAVDFYQMEDAVAARYADRASGYIRAIAEQDLNETLSGRSAIPPISHLGDY